MQESESGMGCPSLLREKRTTTIIAHPIIFSFPISSNSGNVIISEIDGPVVKLELQGACGSCPSSTMTMKMGLERRLREKIPEISEVGSVAD